MIDPNNPKNAYSIKPRLYRIRDIYDDYVAQLLKDHPEYWVQQNFDRRIKNFWVYKWPAGHKPAQNVKVRPGKIIRTVTISKGKYAGKEKKFWVNAGPTKVWINNGPALKHEEVINFDRWRAMLRGCMKIAIVEITNGEEFAMGHSLGRLCARRVERNYSNKQVNWLETNKQPKVMSEKSGKMIPARMVYFMDEDYVRVGWRKDDRVPGVVVYEFSPSGGVKGFKTHFTRTNMQNKVLKLRYEYFPYIINYGDDNS